MSDDPIHNHPTVQGLLKSHTMHRRMIVGLVVAVVAAAGMIGFHQVRMMDQQAALSNTLRMD